MSAFNHRIRTRAIEMVSAIAIAVASGAMASAQDLAAPSDPVAKAAFDVLEKHCARCHQEGKLSARERPSKNFGNVLKLEELAANPQYIIPGNPLGSKLFKQIADKEMPYDVQYEGASFPLPTEDEIKALTTWIEALGTKTAAACEGRKFVSHADMIGMMAADLEKQQRTRRKGTRYLTLTHLKNACMDDKAMEVYRQGAIKLINSLSRSSDVVRLEAIDPEGTIIRINLDDIGWEAKDWDTLLAVNPYNTQPESQLTAVLDGATGTKLPYVRADWFAFAASQPPLYHTLLKLPKTFKELQKAEGVDVDGNLKKFQAQRSGFQKSGVSQNNRLIERHSSRSGYFWTSYDFAGNKAKQSLFEFPLGPGGDNGFDADGGETIFSLPNGFQAYYLNTAKGDILEKGPTSIVRDLSRKDLAVTNGISCMGCHDQGMRKAKDEVRAIVLAGRTFPRETKEAVEALYPETDKMDRVIDDDAKRFADAMVRAGLDPTLKLNGVEMINALAKRYEDDVDLRLAAAEMSMSADEFKEASTDASRKFRPLIRRLEQGAVPRDQFESFYRELANEITDEETVKVAAAGKVEVAKPKSGELSLISDKDEYKVGDSPVFTVVAPKDCFLTLTNVDDKGLGTVLFPNKFQQDNKIKAGASVLIPGAKAPFVYRMKDKGVETVTAVCKVVGGEVDGIKHDFTRSAFTNTGNYTSSVARSLALEGGTKRAIAVDPVKPEAKPAAKGPAPKVVQKEEPKVKPVASDERESIRAAIKIGVK
jgi:Domain of unknown function (DUF4384)